MEKQPTDSKQTKKKSPLNDYLKYSGLALQMLVTIGLAVALGYFLDTRLGLLPLFTLFFTIASLIATIYWLIKTV